MKDRRIRRLERIARRAERTARRKQISTNPIYTMEKKADVVIGKSENIVFLGFPKVYLWFPNVFSRFRDHPEGI